MAYVPYVDLIPFMPTISGSITAGIGTYTLQVGQSIIVGNIIFMTGSLSWNTHTGTGNMLLDNLPFKVRNLLNFNPEIFIRTESIPWPASTACCYGELQPNTYHASVGIYRSNLPSLPILMNSSGTLHFTGTYLK